MGRQVAHVAAALVMGALAVACSGRSDGAGSHADQDAATRATNNAIRVRGCVQAAPGMNRYVLQHVTLAPPEQQAAPGTAMSQPPAITEGSWVRLDPGNQRLDDFMGKTVTIDGRLVDDGHTTIGTSGSSDPNKANAQDAPDASSSAGRANSPATVPPRAAIANGTAPKIAVERITTIKDGCPPNQELLEEGHTGQKGLAPKRTATGR